MIGLTDNSKQTLQMKRMFELFFYACSKWRFPDDRGSVSNAVFFGFWFPLIIAFGYGFGIINELFHIKASPIVVLLIVLLFQTLLFFYYKNTGKGEKIISYYEQTKYNKWYRLLFIFILGQIILMTLIIITLNVIEKVLEKCLYP